MSVDKSGKILIESLEVLEDVSFPKMGIPATTSINQPKFPGVEMSLGDGVVVVKHKGFEGIIPLHNIRQANLVNEVQSK